MKKHSSQAFKKFDKTSLFDIKSYSAEEYLLFLVTSLEAPDVSFPIAILVTELPHEERVLEWWSAVSSRSTIRLVTREEAAKYSRSARLWRVTEGVPRASLNEFVLLYRED